MARVSAMKGRRDVEVEGGAFMKEKDWKDSLSSSDRFQNIYCRCECDLYKSHEKAYG